MTEEKRRKEGRGLGRLSDYIPWIKVYEVKSSGVCWRILGEKTNRIHHFLSTLEKKVFLFYDNHSEVIDIREQFPLDLKETLAISSFLKLKHISFEDKPVTMTTDFLIDFKDKQIAISVKPKGKLTIQALKKFQVEFNYWRNLSVPCFIYTETEIAELEN